MGGNETRTNKTRGKETSLNQKVKNKKWINEGNKRNWITDGQGETECSSYTNHTF